MIVDSARSLDAKKKVIMLIGATKDTNKPIITEETKQSQIIIKIIPSLILERNCQVSQKSGVIIVVINLLNRFVMFDVCACFWSAL